MDCGLLRHTPQYPAFTLRGHELRTGYEDRIQDVHIHVTKWNMKINMLYIMIDVLFPVPGITSMCTLWDALLQYWIRYVCEHLVHALQTMYQLELQ